MALYHKDLLEPHRRVLSTIDHSKRAWFCPSYKLLWTTITSKNPDHVKSFSRHLQYICVYCSHNDCKPYTEYEYFLKSQVDIGKLTAKQINQFRPIHWQCKDQVGRPNYCDAGYIPADGLKNCSLFNLRKCQTGKYIFVNGNEPFTRPCSHSFCDPAAPSIYACLRGQALGKIQKHDLNVVLRHGWGQKLDQVARNNHDITNAILDQTVWPMMYQPYMWMPLRTIPMTDVEASFQFRDTVPMEGMRPPSNT